MNRLLFLLSLTTCLSLNAQVEIFRGDIDTSTYIKPEDTITLSPVYGSGVQDFLTYIETHFNQRLTAFNAGGDVIRVSFVIKKDGEVDDYKTLSFSNATLATELERVIVNMPAWSPGYETGRKKNTLMVYELKLRQVSDNVSGIQVLINENTLQYTDKTNAIKWGLVGSTVIILLTVLLTRGR